MTRQGARAARRVAWILLGIALVTTLSFGVVDDRGDRTDRERVADLSETIACPRCSGQSVAESDVAIAREIRADIARRVDEGQTDDQIRQVYVDRYGEWVNLNPSSAGVTGLVWVIPVVGAAAGLAVLVVAFWRWRTLGTTDGEATEEDRALVDRALRS